jgi:hypothetical protein
MRDKALLKGRSEENPAPTEKLLYILTHKEV